MKEKQAPGINQEVGDFSKTPMKIMNKTPADFVNKTFDEMLLEGAPIKRFKHNLNEV